MRAFLVGHTRIYIYAVGTDIRTFGMRSEGNPLGGASLEG